MLPSRSPGVTGLRSPWTRRLARHHCPPAPTSEPGATWPGLHTLRAPPATLPPGPSPLPSPPSPRDAPGSGATWPGPPRWLDCDLPSRGTGFCGHAGSGPGAGWGRRGQSREERKPKKRENEREERERGWCTCSGKLVTAGRALRACACACACTRVCVRVVSPKICPRLGGGPGWPTVRRGKWRPSREVPQLQGRRLGFKFILILKLIHFNSHPTRKGGKSH